MAPVGEWTLAFRLKLALLPPGKFNTETPAFTVTYQDVAGFAATVLFQQSFHVFHAAAIQDGAQQQVHRNAFQLLVSGQYVQANPQPGVVHADFADDAGLGQHANSMAVGALDAQIHNKAFQQP